LLVVAIPFFRIILIVGIAPVFGNAAADTALLGFGYIAFTHVTPPDMFIIKFGSVRL